MEEKKGLAKTIADLLKGYVDEQTIEKVILVVKNYSLAAGAAAGAAEIIPGGAVVASVATVGFIWGMYYKICKEINLDLKKTMLKAIASAMATNMAAYYGGMVAMNVIFNLIPGLNVGGAVLGAVLQFGMVYASGVLFIMVLTRVFKATDSIGAVKDMSEEELVKVAMEVTKSHGKKIGKQAIKEYKDVKNDPNTSGEGIEAMED